MLVQTIRQGITLFSDCGELMVQEAQDAFGKRKLMLRRGMDIDMGDDPLASNVSGEAAWHAGGPAGIAWDRLVLGHRALQVLGHPSPEILPRVTGEVPPVEVLERYLKVSVEWGCGSS